MTRLLLVLALVFPSCRSIKATYIGNPEHGEEVGGLPIVVMQPRYLKVTYKVVTWRVGRGERAVDEDSREIATETICVGNLYALDVERPAAGSAHYAVELAKDGYYPSKVSAKIEDETLATVGEQVAKLAERIGGARAAAGAATIDEAGRVKLREAVEKVEIYDLGNLATPVVVYR